MKKKLVVLLMLILVGSFAFADEYNKVLSYQCGPGTVYSYYEGVSHTWAIHVTEIDLTNPYITIESVLAQDRFSGTERTSSMSSRSDKVGHRSVCAINGDFFNGSGQPINNQVLDGQFVRGYTYHRSAFTYSEDGIPGIVIPQVSGTLICEDSLGAMVSNGINVINDIRYENYLVIYNGYYGSTTQTNPHGYECLASAITDWVVNDTVLAVIEAVENGVGNMPIPDGKFVLSGHGTSKTFLMENCAVGDTVKVVQSLANAAKRIKELVGGGPWILKNGIDITASNNEGISSSFYAVRHPRTGVGYSADSTKVYFMVVDGRQADLSIGMTCHEMCDFFKFIGAEHAMNLDGGGSSAIVVRNNVKNSPSDGGERSVANALVCVSSAPSGGSFVHLQKGVDSVAVYKNKSVETGFSGWDEYYNPIEILDWSQITVDYDQSLGNFDANVFTAFENDGDTYIKTLFDGESDSVKIHIIELKNLSVYPDTLTLDTVNSVEYQVSATTEGGGTRVFSNELFEFTILDPTIAEIDSEGVIIGKQGGETDVVIAYGDEIDTVRVRVQIGEGEIVVDEIESISAWNMRTDAYIDEANTSISLCDRSTGTGTKAIQVDYTRTGDEDGNIYLETNAIDLYGVPSDILIDVESDSNKNWIYALMEDNRGVEYSVKCASSLKYKNEYRTQYLDFSKMLPADGEQLYPLKFKGLRLRIDDKATSGSMYIDRVRVIYPTWTAIEDHDANVIPENFKLLQNYPNPFNPSTCIDFQLSSDAHVELSIYSLNGKKVATLLNGVRAAGNYSVHFDASDLAGGVYFYRLQAGNWVDTKKMLLIK